MPRIPPLVRRLALSAVLLGPTVLGAQNPFPSRQSPFPNPGARPPGWDEPPQLPPALRERQLHARAKQNNARIKAEAAQLLQLAQQLKAAVDKAGQNELSLSVVRRAERIRKLADKISHQMRNGS